MIVPMKKVNLVVLDRERLAALAELKKLGTVHITDQAAAGPSLETLLEKHHQASLALAYVRDFKCKTESQPDPVVLVQQIHGLVEEKKALDENLRKNLREIDRLTAWGSFEPADLLALKDWGLDLVPFEMSAKTYAALDPTIKTVKLQTSKAKVRCLVVREQGQLPEKLPADAFQLVLPEQSLAEIQQQTAAVNTRLAAIEKELHALASGRAVLSRYLEQVAAEIEFDKARLGMEVLLDDEGANSLILLEGFVPADGEAALTALAKKNHWAIIIDDPADDDQVPTLVQNNQVVSLVQPLMDFLGTVPGYREYEISALFLFFFCIFTAMIFGDGGYGLILLIGTSLLIWQKKRKGQEVAPILKLVLLLSGCITAWGIMTLSWLGLTPEQLPGFLKMIDIDWLSNENPQSGEHIKIVCFIIGTVQLSIAHIKNIRRDIGTLKWLGQLGQLLMHTGMLNVVLNIVIDAQMFPMQNWALSMVAVGFVLNFVFANYEGSIGKSIMASVTGLISVILGVVNVFGDIVSYIRLWAVGLAGAAISNTVNTMLGPLLGRFTLFAVGILAIVFCHSFNMVLNVMSVLVHAIRLNILEFSGHLGLEWSGFKYDPFRERVSSKD